MDIVPLELCNMGSVPWCLALSSIPLSAIRDTHVGDPQENWELSCFYNSFDDLALGAVISLILWLPITPYQRCGGAGSIMGFSRHAE